VIPFFRTGCNPMAPFTSIFLSFAISLAAASKVCRTEDGALGAGCFDDEAASFLQKAVHAAHASGDASSNEVNAVTQVEAIDCHLFKKPLQMLPTEGGYAIKALNISTGAYDDLFDIPFNRVWYQKINACGVSPIDSMLYCAVFADGSYVARVGANTMEFVARLPWFDHYIAGGFAPSGNFFIATYYMEILVLKNLHQAKGHNATEKKNEDAEIIDLREKKLLYPTGFLYGADIVGVNMNLQGHGLEEYVIVLHGSRLQIAKYDNKHDTFVQSWLIKVRPPRDDNIYGAGWNYQNKVFWAANNGNGVYEVPWTRIKPEYLNNGFPDDFELVLTLAGKSDAVVFNDGMNCLSQPDPWITQVRSFPCKEYPGFIQAMIEPTGYSIQSLNYTTGTYKHIYDIPFTMTTPPFHKLNAFSIGPISSVVYATLVMDDWNNDIYPTPPPFYIVRIDEEAIEFVCKVQAPFGQPIAGTHDGDGHYWVISNPSLLKIPLSHTFQGFRDQRDEHLPYFGPTSDIIAIRNMTGLKQVADIVQIYANFDGQGVSKWLVGANHVQQFLAIKLSENPQYYILETNDIFSGKQERQNFGAAWFFGNKEFYLSSNDGFGVYKVDMSEIGANITGYDESSGDCTGGDLEIFDFSDGSACLAACNKDPECYGYEVSTKYQECVTVDYTCKRKAKRGSLFYSKKADAAKPVVELVKVGHAKQVENNDGMNCRPDRVKRTKKIGCTSQNCQPREKNIVEYKERHKEHRD